MHNPVPSCFSGGAAAEENPTASICLGPRAVTSVYETRLGLAVLTWYRTALGLSLHVDLRLPSPASPSGSASSCASSSGFSSASEEWTDASFHFRLRPWLFWKRRGTKRFQLKGEEYEDRRHHHHHRPTVDFAWDLARARFAPGGGPEPAARFFVAVAVDGEMLLVVGDMEAEAYEKTQAGRSTIPTHPSKKGSLCGWTLVSRREHVVLPSSGMSYTTRASFGGKEREISIDLGGADGRRDAKLSMGLDGERVLHVKRLRWKFRGNEEVEAEGGVRVQVSWDVHRWLFGRGLDPSPPAAAAATSGPGHAVLLFRFDREEPEEEEDVAACTGKHRRASATHGVGGGMLGPYGVGGFFSGGVIDAVGVSKRAGRKKSLLKTRSSSSSSSASSGSSSSVMEWATAEEDELRGWDAFSLVVNLWKN